MFKLNKLLLKRAFKLLYTNKIFTILIMILIFISGTTFTIFSSSANAFNSSYNHVVSRGNLHEYVIKENFQFTKNEINNSKIYFAISKDGKNYNLPQNQANADVSEINDLYTIETIPGQSQPQSNLLFSVGLDKTNKATGIYQEYNSENINEQISITKNNNDLIINQEDVAKIYSKINSIKSEITSLIRKGLASKFINHIRRDYGDELYVKNTESLYVSDNIKSFKVVEYNDVPGINDMIIYDGSKYFTKDITDNEFKNQLDNLLSKQGIDPNVGYSWSKYKGFKQSLSNQIKNGVTLTDPNAFMSIISPAFANKNNKKAVDPDFIKGLFEKNPDLMDNSSNNFEDILRQNNLSNDNVIYVEQTPYFITGIGTTPDFSYPIIDSQRPIVDPQNQAVVFVSPRGYQRILDAFRTSPQENYASLRFKEGVSKTRQKEILKQIEAKATHTDVTSDYPLTYFSKDIPIITSYDQKGDQLLLAQERSTTLSNINTTISILAYTTTTLLVIFIISILIMIFKVLISGSRKVYATLLSLGYSKVQIAVASGISGIVLTGIPSVLAYGAGYGLQFVFMSIFANMWTIPAYANSFSWISLTVMIVIPTLIVFTIMFISTLVELRYKIPAMLSESVEKIGLAEKVTSKFKFAKPQTKYTIALSLKNIGKLALITVSSIIALSSIMVGMGTIGKSNYAYNATVALTKYSFAIDLATPTKEGGQYGTLTPYGSGSNNALPKVDVNSTEIYTPQNFGTSFRSDKRALWHVPSATDGPYAGVGNLPQDVFQTGQTNWNNVNNQDLLRYVGTYLKNVLQTKLLLEKMNNQTSGAGFNPWSIAERLMPENQRRQANSNAVALEQQMKSDGLTPQEVVERNAMQGDTMPYIISYNKVIIDEQDELYTYVKGNITDNKSNVTIRGIDSNSKMINISKDLLSKMDNFNETKMVTNADGTKVQYRVMPVVINKYLESVWKASVGSYLNMNVSNGYNRHNTDKKNNIMIKVVGIVNGYNSTNLYTSRRQANQILGFTDITNGFNGIFTKSKNPTLLKTLPLYSESGLYVSSDSFTGKWNNYLTNYLNSGLWNNDKVKDASQFIAEYSDTPYVSLLSNVRWNRMDEILFKEVTKLSSSIINIIETITIMISIIFTIIIATLMFRMNKKKIAALWALGYRKREVNKIFISMYVIPLILATIVSVPIAFALLYSLKTFIIGFGHVLIPLSLSWWMPFLAVVPVALIFIIATTITIYTQRQDTALAAFKGD